MAPDPEQTDELADSGAVCVAYETVTDVSGGLPLLKPMSQVAGRMSIQAGAGALEKAHGGRGVLLGGVPGVQPAKVCVIGGGVVGFNAAQMAVGLGADVTILDRSPEVLSGSLSISKRGPRRASPTKPTSPNVSPRLIWSLARCSFQARQRRSW